MAPATTGPSLDQRIFAEIAARVAVDGVAYQGVDKEGNLMFRMPPSTGLLSQEDAARWGRRIFDRIMESKVDGMKQFLDKAAGFKIIAASR